ncbi:MAG: putative toxin-antitoxin system toxin component, PIN family [Candidatus Omnitrophota bacterium]
MKVVADTNVLISGLLTPHGPPAEIVRMVLNGNLRVCYDLRILDEYREVFARPKFDISHGLSANLLEQIRASGESANTQPLSQPLLDPSDEAFLETAISGGADCLITGNLKHFPPSCRQGMRVLSPREFLEFYRDWQANGSGKIQSPSVEYRLRKGGKRRRSRH